MNNKFIIISFYQFKKIKDTLKLQKVLKEFCQFNKLKGTILIANEGINFNIGGIDNSIREFKNKLDLLNFDLSNLKYSYSSFMPFYRIKVKIKKEIITFSKKKLNVEKDTAQFVNPTNWNKIINDKNIFKIDIRNNYETKIGTFKNSKIININNFTELKKYINKNLIDMKENKIAMFCTGGIRCEKVSSYMINIGFKNLFQLKGGILKYLETVPKKKSTWNGECFIFDNRVSVKNEMKKGSYDLCHGCRMPLNFKNKISKKFEKGVSCEYCYDKLAEKKKDALRQRNKQIQIAKKRGLYNPYIRMTTSNYN